LSLLKEAERRLAGPQAKVRKDGLLFGEFLGSVLLEVAPDFEAAKLLKGVPYAVAGEVIPEPRLILVSGSTTLWQDEISKLASVWSGTFREVLE
jgi:hypothetical protein